MNEIYENEVNIKLCNNMSGADCRRIFNAAKPGILVLRWILCYILCFYATLDILDGNIESSMMFVFIIEVIVLIHLIFSPIILKKNLGNSLTDEIILSKNTITAGNRYILYDEIERVVVGKDFVVVSTRNDKLSFFFENKKVVEQLCGVLRYYIGTDIVFVEGETSKKSRRVILGIAILVYCGIIGWNIWLPIQYDMSIVEHKQKYEEQYNIEFSVLEHNDKLDKYIFTGVEDKDKVIQAIEDIDDLLNRFPDNIFNEIYLNVNKSGQRQIQVRFILCGDMTVEESSFVPDGVTLYFEDHIDVYVNYNGDYFKNNCAHELLHVMLYGKDWNEEMHRQWAQCNPDDFIYYIDQKNKDGWVRDYRYMDAEEAYFVSAYSKSSVWEDTADIFKYLVTCDSSLPAAYDSPHIQAKAKLLIQWLDEKYESVDEDVYWNKWFKE